MRKFVLLALFAAAVAVTVAPAANSAGDTKGPPCVNIIDGDGSWGVVGTETLHFEIVLKDPACTAVATYTITAQYVSGGTGTVSSSTPNATCTKFPAAGTSCLAFEFTVVSATHSAADVICVTADTAYRGRPADHAPDTPSAGCTDGFALAYGSGGGTSGFG